MIIINPNSHGPDYARNAMCCSLLYNNFNGTLNHCLFVYNGYYRPGQRLEEAWEIQKTGNWYFREESSTQKLFCNLQD